MGEATTGREARAIALSGSRTFLGTEFLRQLSDDPRIERLVAIDVREPKFESDKLCYCPVDLTSPSAGSELARVLEANEIDAVVHGAFLSRPTHASAWAHELEDVGTMHMLDACARTRPTQLMVLSTTLVYGASPDNPNYLSEDAELATITESRFINDKVKVEEQVQRFARNHPEMSVCSLRFAPVLGPTVVNVFTDFLSRPVAPFVSGYDPLMQCTHERDALAAMHLALEQKARGPFNIASKGILPYSTILALLGRVPIPMPTPVVRLVGRAMWATQLSRVPPTMLDLLRFLCVADTSRAEEELGFVPRYTMRQTLQELLGLPDELTNAFMGSGALRRR